MYAFNRNLLRVPRCFSPSPQGRYGPEASSCNQTIWKLIPHSISESLNVTGIVTETQSILISSSHRLCGHQLTSSHKEQLSAPPPPHHFGCSEIRPQEKAPWSPSLWLSRISATDLPLARPPHMRTQTCRTWASQAMNLSSEAPPQRMLKVV